MQRMVDSHSKTNDSTAQDRVKRPGKNNALSSALLHQRLWQGVDERKVHFNQNVNQVTLPRRVAKLVLWRWLQLKRGSHDHA